MTDEQSGSEETGHRAKAGATAVWRPVVDEKSTQALGDSVPASVLQAVAEDGVRVAMLDHYVRVVGGRYVTKFPGMTLYPVCLTWPDGCGPGLQATLYGALSDDRGRLTLPTDDLTIFDPRTDQPLAFECFDPTLFVRHVQPLHDQ